MKLLTGNDLKRGDVLWWTGDGWSLSLNEALGMEQAAGAAVLAAETGHERVSDLALVEAEWMDGKWRPLRVRERIRGFGPTVRPDLALAGQDWR